MRYRINCTKRGLRRITPHTARKSNKSEGLKYISTSDRVSLNHFKPQILTLKEERWLRVFGNRVLRRIFGAKRDEVTGEWRKRHNEELNVVYC
jgi:hypothetical protein